MVDNYSKWLDVDIVSHCDQHIDQHLIQSQIEHQQKCLFVGTLELELT